MSLPKYQKAVVVEKYGASLALKELPVPEVAPGQVLVKVEASIVSGELKARVERPKNPLFCLPEPFVIGTSAVGRVIESDTFKKGQLVYLDPTVWSRDSTEHYVVKSVADGPTPESKALSAQEYKRNGYMSEYTLVDIENCYPINEEAISFDTDIIPGLTFPLVAYGGFRGIDLKPGETVAIGPATGKFSSAAVAVAASMGAKVLALGRNKAALEAVASKFSNVHPVVLTGDKDADAATLQKFGPLDVFMDFTPSGLPGPIYLDTAIGAIKFGGRIILSGFVFGTVAIPYALLVSKDLTIKGKIMYSRQEAKDFIKMVENGIFKVDHVQVKKFSIEKYSEAADDASTKKLWDHQVVLSTK
ncbi:hypothetical protein KL918_004719 [Ogataea parapolymorpha]|uniref:Uncharacterized protein n=1 Tax=Ogataea parapolymorpha (strain ATCC 26012 / BCRC 20466 / JCM 22074 / NRRL Y-7560 / DL-1) TaxID=871575 RepID=W1QIT8_OGAPD|nr:hypothetical protein HPODL_04528 [Ogataea parapolymorpha DL-1]ESX01752.1 hypothetical protein HPODL_04528 [Ogataea parapolymorpha DL-1]KAG7865137.1 hypothetical protein KL918_004719 [Ogataea parapolymorpha]KAG7872722.1 hypothetical protein KL916_002767 [Ogataea parapolymorpha]